jgi:hypothetical protein
LGWRLCFVWFVSQCDGSLASAMRLKVTRIQQSLLEVPSMVSALNIAG